MVRINFIPWISLLGQFSFAYQTVFTFFADSAWGKDEANGGLHVIFIFIHQ